MKFIKKYNTRQIEKKMFSFKVKIGWGTNTAQNIIKRNKKIYTKNLQIQISTHELIYIHKTQF